MAELWVRNGTVEVVCRLDGAHDGNGVTAVAYARAARMKQSSKGECGCGVAALKPPTA
jgi:hypothetical protein